MSELTLADLTDEEVAAYLATVLSILDYDNDPTTNYGAW